MQAENTWKTKVRAANKEVKEVLKSVTKAWRKETLLGRKQGGGNSNRINRGGGGGKRANGIFLEIKV